MTEDLISQSEKDKLTAALKFIRRMGSSSVQIRYSDDEKPIVWFVIALFDGKNPAAIHGHEVHAAFSPVDAALGLCEKLADGGMCTHCRRPVGFEPELLVRMPADKLICWYQYDPELKTFRRGCE